MKKNWKMIVVSAVFFTVITLLSTACMAQVLGEPDDPLGDPDAPIDGGVVALVAAGIGYGIKKYRVAGKNKVNL